MPISFPFNFQKALQSMAYLLGRLGPTEKVKLMKLLYIADRNHFLSRGYPITGSKQVAMPYGPLPSSCLDVLDGEYWPNRDAAFQFLHLDNYTVSLKQMPQMDALEATERTVLEKVAEAYGKAQEWDLVKHTHKFPEYEAVYEVGTSKPITYELLLSIYKAGEGFRHGRPVIGEEMARRRTYEFTAPSDTDL